VRLISTAGTLPPSPARQDEPSRPSLRIAAVQHQWHPDAAEHAAALRLGVQIAALDGAELVCLPELTLLPYFAVSPQPGAGVALAETIPDGRTCEFASRAAGDYGVHVVASLYERAADGRGYNTAICASPNGEILGHTRKTHIPAGAGYHENLYFAAGDSGFPVIDVLGAKCGLPTCYDQWFPEVARAYALAGADVVIYPTAIGSEPDHPWFDTEPLWEQVITAQGIVNGLFMAAVNRIGTEGPVTFYGSSFISDPYGRVLVQAPRDEPVVLVADLDLDQRRDWLTLFPLLTGRRPELYGGLTRPTPDAPA
jgi:N-carbamoylputrescine amidase